MVPSSLSSHLPCRQDLLLFPLTAPLHPRERRKSTGTSTLEWIDFRYPSFLCVRNHLGTKQQAPNPATDIVDQQECDDDDSRQFQHSDLVALLGHAGQAAGAALDARAHVAEDFVGVVEGVLAACIVVDVQCDVFQGRGLLREGGEERIVLSERC